MLGSRYSDKQMEFKQHKMKGEDEITESEKVEGANRLEVGLKQQWEAIWILTLTLGSILIRDMRKKQKHLPLKRMSGKAMFSGHGQVRKRR